MHAPLRVLALLVSILVFFSGCSARDQDPEAKDSSGVTAIPREVSMELQDRAIPIGSGIWFRAERGQPAVGYTNLVLDLDDPANDPAAVAVLRDKLARVNADNAQTWRVVYGHMEGDNVVAGAGVFYYPPPRSPESDGTIRLVIREDKAVNSLDELVRSGSGLVTFAGVTVPVDESTSISASGGGSISESHSGSVTPTSFDIGFDAREGKLTRVSFKVGAAMRLRETLQSEYAFASLGAGGEKFRLGKGEKELGAYSKYFFAQAGVVPIFGEVRTSIGVGWEVGGRGKLNRARAEATLDGSIQIEADCRIDSGCETRIPVKAMSLTPDVQGDADVKAAIAAGVYATFRVQLLLYKVIGPELSLHAPFGRVAAVYRDRSWSRATSIGGQIKGAVSFLGFPLGAAFDGPLCNFYENGELAWRCYGTQEDADDAMSGGLGDPNRALLFPALFDNARNGVHPRSADRVGSILSLQNPTPYRATVKTIARGDDGVVLSSGEVVLDPNSTMEISSVDGTRSGAIFNDATRRAGRFSLELVPDERVLATTLHVRIAEDGQPLGSTNRPAQLASLRAIESATSTADVVFSQMPDRGDRTFDETFASEAYLMNPSDEPAQVVGILRCNGREKTKVFELREHRTISLRPQDMDPEYSAKCTFHLRTSDAVRLAGSTLWANSGRIASSSALIAVNGVSRGAKSFVPARVMWHRVGFDSGVQVMNVGDRDTRVVLSFLFPGRRPEYRRFDIVRTLPKGDVYSLYMGVDQIEGVPAPFEDEVRGARDGTVTITSDDQPVVVNVNVDNRSYGGAWTLVPASGDEVGKRLFFPGLYRTHPAAWATRVGGSDTIVTSGLTLTNASATETNRCSINYQFGNDFRTTWIELGPRESLNQFLPNPVGGVEVPRGHGSAVVVCSQPASGEVSMRIAKSYAENSWLEGDACDSTTAFIER